MVRIGRPMARDNARNLTSAIPGTMAEVGEEARSGHELTLSEEPLTKAARGVNMLNVVAMIMRLRRIPRVRGRDMRA
jgi:hypothetical protein